MILQNIGSTLTGLLLSLIIPLFEPDKINGLESKINSKVNSDVFSDEWNPGFARIAGGEEIAIDAAPYNVLIRFNSTPICSGFIISSRWIMTAAQCVNGLPAANITIRAGSSSANSGGVLLNAISVQPSGLYNSTNKDFDFALIQINETLTFNATIANITLAEATSFLPIFGKLFISGWGVNTSSSTNLATSLRGVRTPIMFKPLCQLMYGGILTDNMFCGGVFLFGGIGTCLGDLGGAVVYNRYAIGVVSGNGTCGDPWKPSVFARVSKATTWAKGVASIP